MKPDIHPNYQDVKVSCSCGNSFTTRSTIAKDLHLETCSQCHPFFTGKQQTQASGGRVARFKERYGKKA